MQQQIVGLALSLAILVMLVLVLARKSPFVFFGKLMRPFTRLIAAILRFFRLVPKVSNGSNHAYVGPSAWAAFARAFQSQTEAEKALGDDLDHPRTHIERHGVLFRWLSPKAGFITQDADFNDKHAEEYTEKSRLFFSKQVPVLSNPTALYEDVEAAFIIGCFKNADSNSFYLLNEMRKAINANVRKLAVMFSTIAALVLIANLFFAPYADFAFLEGALSATPVGTDLSSPEAGGDVSRAIFAAFTCAGGAFLMWLLYYIEFIPYQRNNARELNNYITRYLAILNDQFKTGVGRAKAVTVGQEKDPNTLSASARNWFISFQWIGFRIFFVESFIRNVLFQVRRNSSYYLSFVPLLFIAVLAVGLYVADLVSMISAGALFGSLSPFFYLFFLLLIALYIHFLVSSVRGIMESIKQDEWIGFDNLRFHETMADVVGKFAEDVGYWKNRVGGIG